MNNHTCAKMATVTCNQIDIYPFSFGDHAQPSSASTMDQLYVLITHIHSAKGLFTSHRFSKKHRISSLNNESGKIVDRDDEFNRRMELGKYKPKSNDNDTFGMLHTNGKYLSNVVEN